MDEQQCRTTLATPARFLPQEVAYVASLNARFAPAPTNRNHPRAGRRAREFTTAHPVPGRSDTDRHQLAGQAASSGTTQTQPGADETRDRRLPVLVPCRNILEAKLVRLENQI